MKTILLPPKRAREIAREVAPLPSAIHAISEGLSAAAPIIARAVLEMAARRICLACARGEVPVYQPEMEGPVWWHGEHRCPASALRQMEKEIEP